MASQTPTPATELRSLKCKMLTYTQECKAVTTLPVLEKRPGCMEATVPCWQNITGRMGRRDVRHGRNTRPTASEHRPVWIAEPWLQQSMGERVHFRRKIRSSRRRERREVSDPARSAQQGVRVQRPSDLRISR